MHEAQGYFPCVLHVLINSPGLRVEEAGVLLEALHMVWCPSTLRTDPFHTPLHATFATKRKRLVPNPILYCRIHASLVPTGWATSMCPHRGTDTNTPQLWRSLIHLGCTPLRGRQQKMSDCGLSHTLMRGNAAQVGSHRRLQNCPPGVASCHGWHAQPVKLWRGHSMRCAALFLQTSGLG